MLARSFSIQPGRESFAGKQSSEKETFQGKNVITDGFTAILYAVAIM